MKIDEFLIWFGLLLVLALGMLLLGQGMGIRLTYADICEQITGDRSYKYDEGLYCKYDDVYRKVE